MELNLTTIIFVLLVVDSLSAVVMSWCGKGWWLQNLGIFAKWFPPAKGWSLLYLVLVLVIGYLLGLY